MAIIGQALANSLVLVKDISVTWMFVELFVPWKQGDSH